MYKPYTAYMNLGMSMGRVMPRARSYQLWSAGENAVYEMNSSDGVLINGVFTSLRPDADQWSAEAVFVDDITNWKAVQE